jgi:hypothetical protein
MNISFIAVAPRKANGEPTPTAFADNGARWCVSFASGFQLSLILCPRNRSLRAGQPVAPYLQSVNVLMFGNLLLIVCRAMSTPIAIP